MTLKNTYIVVLFISFLTIYGQNSSVSGYVLRGNSNYVEGVSISLINASSGKEDVTRSNSEGAFHFDNMPYGYYTLFYENGDLEDFITVDLNKPIVSLDVLLNDHKVVLDNIDIYSQSRKDQIETSGFAVNVVNIDKMALQSIQTNDLLDRTAGVKIRQDGGLGSRVNYNINGLSGRSVKIFIDGIPADNFGGSFSLNSIPSSSIERIEVYKGVVPTSLSQDALGGAINIILKQKRTNSFSVSGSYGSFNTSQFNTNGSYRGDNGFTVNATAFYNNSDNDYRVYGPHVKFKDYNGKITYPQNGAKRFNDGYWSYGTKVDVGFTDVKWADKFLIGGILSKNRKEIQHGSTMENVYGDRFTRQTSNVITLNYTKKDFLLEGLEFKLDGNYSNLREQAIDTVGNQYDWSGNPIRDADGNIIKYNSGAEVASQKTLEINDDKTYGVRANLAYEFIVNNTFSVNYFYNKFDRNISDELQPKVVELLMNTRGLEKNIIALGYENLAFEGRLRTNVFFKRYDQKAVSKEPFIDKTLPLVGSLYKEKRITKSVNHNGYGIALSYRIIPKIYALSSVEKAIRMPSDLELFGNNINNLLSSFDLEPERSTNVNMGFNAGPYVFNEHSLSFNATFFYRNTQGMIRESVDSRGIFTQYENLDDVLSKGIDAELNYMFKEKLVFNFSISKFDVLFNRKFDKNGGQYLYYKTQIRNEPSFKFNANLSYAFSDVFTKGSSLNVYYNVYYVKKFLRNWSNVGGANLDEIPTQYPNDLGLAYQLPNRKTTISFDAKNIFNQFIYDNFGLQKPGKGFYGKLTHSFF